MSLDHTDDKSILAQVTACYCQALEQDKFNAIHTYNHTGLSIISKSNLNIL